MMNLLTLLAQTETAAEESLIPPPPRDAHEGTYWFPENASTFANDVDSLFMLIFWVSLVFFAGIVGAMIYFVMKYRHTPGHQPEKSPSHNTILEIAWSVLPGFLLVWFFVDGANGWFNQRITPGNAERIQVVGQQFNWQFFYPNGDGTTELHLVQNRPVEFEMESRDVLHSFFIPAFRQKQDLVPGRYTYCWVKPTKVGTYRLYCSEYCGDSHSLMLTNVTVHATEEERDAATYYDWGAESDDNPLNPKRRIANGKRLFNMKCSGCHNATEAAKTGPGLGGIWGKMETLTDGTQVKVDATYFRESLLNPGAKIVSGYTNQMTSFQGQLNDDQIFWLKAYIMSISPDAVADEPDNPAAAEDAPEAAEQPAGEEN